MDAKTKHRMSYEIILPCYLIVFPKYSFIYLEIIWELGENNIWGQIPKTREQMFLLCSVQMMLYGHWH